MLKRTTFKIIRLVRRKIRKKLRIIYSHIVDPSHTPWILEHCREIGPKHNHIYACLVKRRNIDKNIMEHGLIESFMKDGEETRRLEKVITKERFDNIKDSWLNTNQRFH